MSLEAHDELVNLRQGPSRPVDAKVTAEVAANGDLLDVDDTPVGDND